MLYSCEICDGEIDDKTDRCFLCFSCASFVCVNCVNCEQNNGLAFRDFQKMLNLKSGSERGKHCEPGRKYIQCPRCEGY